MLLSVVQYEPSLSGICKHIVLLAVNRLNHDFLSWSSCQVSFHAYFGW